MVAEAPRGLLGLGMPGCAACMLLPASLEEIRRARPDLAVAIGEFATVEDWAQREELLWPRGIHVSRSSVPVLALLADGEVIASRAGGGPAFAIDRWLEGLLGPAAQSLGPSPTAGELAALDALTDVIGRHRAVKRRRDSWLGAIWSRTAGRRHAPPWMAPARGHGRATACRDAHVAPARQGGSPGPGVFSVAPRRGRNAAGWSWSAGSRLEIRRQVFRAPPPRSTPRSPNETRICTCGRSAVLQLFRLRGSRAPLARRRSVTIVPDGQAGSRATSVWRTSRPRVTNPP